ncbi:MAG: hypothetical protein PHT31_00960 [Candidatus Omnitrophica bacterium]|nr:hypothetical protein [Candidatus Omnitrophota bacterium]MDD5652715.1 hypothetical protein [Candidatus Omnitrophota bacterium]
MKTKGIFTISIDLELAWGVCDKVISPGAYKAISSERQIIKDILDLFSKFDIRATWAVVGHLLLSKCKRGDPLIHPEIPRPIANNLKNDWFFQHPVKDADPFWYGQDIIKAIKDARPRQEIASHSFSHMIFDERTANPAAALADLTKAKELHLSLGLPFEIFVFPRNKVGFKNLLSQTGVSGYRGKNPRWYDMIPAPLLKRMINLLYFVFSVPPEAVAAQKDEFGMVNIPDSMLFSGRDGIRRVIPGSALVKMGKAGLDKAAETGKIFHLWFHPSNFTCKTKQQFSALEKILNYAVLLKQNGRLEVLTLNDISNQIKG